VVAADACASYGFELPDLGQDILDEARKRARAEVIRFGNPLDLGNISHLSSFSSVVEKALCSAEFDGVVFIQVSQMTIEREVTQQLAKSISALSSRLRKPVAVVMEIPLEERIFMEKNLNFPFFFDPTEAIQSLAIQNQYRKINEKITPAGDLDEATLPVKDIEEWFRTIEREGRQPLLDEAFDLLEMAGVPTVPWRMARSQEEALGAAEDLGYPLALKAVSPSLLHKSDRGGVSLNVSDDKSLLEEYRRLNSISNDISGIMVQKMMPQSREIIIGGKGDPSFGPVILVGLGGIMVEVFRDVQIRLAPIDTATALQMLTALSGADLLGRFRGMQESDRNAAARMMARVSVLMKDFPQIQEMDLNPVALDNGGKGAFALDARILLTKGPGVSKSPRMN
jgi:acetyltransferase